MNINGFPYPVQQTPGYGGLVAGSPRNALLTAPNTPAPSMNLYFQALGYDPGNYSGGPPPPDFFINRSNTNGIFFLTPLSYGWNQLYDGNTGYQPFNSNDYGGWQQQGIFPPVLRKRQALLASIQAKRRDYGRLIAPKFFRLAQV